MTSFASITDPAYRVIMPGLVIRSLEYLDITSMHIITQLIRLQ